MNSTETKQECKTAIPRGKYTLQYFPIPGAPGEICRILLHLGGFDWNDEVVPGTKWGALKPSTKYHQMPVLTSHSDGHVLTQSKAIARYLACGVTLNGEPLVQEDNWHTFQVDEFVEVLEDVRFGLYSTFAIKDQQEKMAARAAMLAVDGTGKIFEGLKRIERQLEANNSNGYMVGSTFSLADAWTFIVMNQLRCGFLEGIPSKGWLEQLPKLHAVVKNFAAIPEVNAYYSAKAKSEKGKFFTAHASGNKY